MSLEQSIKNIQDSLDNVKELTETVSDFWASAWTFALRWAQNNNDVNATTVIDGSYMEYTEY